MMTKQGPLLGNRPPQGGEFGYIFKIISPATTKESLRKAYSFENYEFLERIRSDAEIVQFVQDKYKFVHEEDRVGRMLDAITLHNYRVPKAAFSEAVIQNLKMRAPGVVYEIQGSDGVEYLVFRHVYLQRKVTPLDQYVRKLIDKMKHTRGVKEVEAYDREIKRVLREFGQIIKDLASAGIWVGDIKTKNYGVTDSGRVVSYDYDEVDKVTDVIFNNDEPGGEVSSGDWWWDPYLRNLHIHGHIYLKDFLGKMGLPRHHEDLERYIRYFSEVHGDLFKKEYWDKIQEDSRTKVKVRSYKPYAPEKTLDRWISLHPAAARLAGHAQTNLRSGSRFYLLDADTLYARLRVNTLLAIDYRQKRLVTNQFNMGVYHKERIILGRPFVLLAEGNTLFVAGGSSHNILAFDKRTGQLDPQFFNQGIFKDSEHFERLLEIKDPTVQIAGDQNFLKRPTSMLKDGDILYVTGEESNTVIAIDLKTGRLNENQFNRGVLRLPDLEGPTALEKIGDTLYIAGRYSNTVVAIDLNKGKLDNTKFGGTGILKDEAILKSPLALKSFGDTLFVAGYASNTVVAVDHRSGAVDKSKFEAGVFRHDHLDEPIGLDVLGDSLYISLSRNGNLFAVDPKKGSLDVSKFHQGIFMDTNHTGPSQLLEEKDGILFSISDSVEQPPRVANVYRYKFVKTNLLTGDRKVEVVDIRLEAPPAARLSMRTQLSGLKTIGGRLALSLRAREKAVIPFLLGGAVALFSFLPSAHAGEVRFDATVAAGQVRLHKRVNLKQVRKELAANRLSESFPQSFSGNQVDPRLKHSGMTGEEFSRSRQEALFRTLKRLENAAGVNVQVPVGHHLYLATLLRGKNEAEQAQYLSALRIFKEKLKASDREDYFVFEDIDAYRSILQKYEISLQSDAIPSQALQRQIRDIKGDLSRLHDGFAVTFVDAPEGSSFLDIASTIMVDSFIARINLNTLTEGDRVIDLLENTLRQLIGDFTLKLTRSDVAVLKEPFSQSKLPVYRKTAIRAVVTAVLSRVLGEYRLTLQGTDWNA